MVKKKKKKKQNNANDLKWRKLGKNDEMSIICFD